MGNFFDILSYEFIQKSECIILTVVVALEN